MRHSIRSTKSPWGAVQASTRGTTRSIEIQHGVQQSYADVYTPEALAAIEAMSSLDDDRRRLMADRIRRRLDRALAQPIGFLDPQALIGRTNIRFRTRATAISSAARFPATSQRQWIQGTGPAAKPNAPVDKEHSQRRLCAAVRRRRLDVRRRRRAGPGLDDVARQPAEPEAGDRIAIRSS